jgi:putative oxidoreductase
MNKTMTAALLALALLIMTPVIQIVVYPDAYPAHGVWMTVLLFLVARGGGVVSLDHWLGQCLSGKCARVV